MTFETSRWVLTAVAGVVGFGTIAADFNRIHVFHPDWPKHARFHVVTYVFMNAAAASVAAWLLWAPGTTQNGYMAACALLGAAHLALFVAAAVPGSDAAAEGEPVVLGLAVSLWVTLVSGVVTAVGAFGLLS